MTSPNPRFHTSWTLLSLLLTLFPSPFLALNQDGILLLSFKYSVLNDPLSVLSNWNYDDSTPCSWNGVMCMGFPNTTTFGSNFTTTSRVISVVLPNSQLLGSIPPDLGLIEHLRHLDLSSNFLNGSLPDSLFNATDLKTLSLADNEISGEIPNQVGKLTHLETLNLSDNAFTGGIPTNLALLPNLTVVSLRSNYISGGLPAGGFGRVQVLDLSSNLINGSVPPDLGGEFQYLNLSYNRLSGEIPKDLGSKIADGGTVDLSFNNLTGGIPEAGAFLAQKPVAFAGNPDLCGKPLKNLCTIPSTLSNPPNASSTTSTPESPPAFAAIPKSTNQGGNSEAGGREGSGGGGQGGFRPATIAAIVIGDLGGIALLFVAFLYVYQNKKKKKEQQKNRGIEVKKNSAAATIVVATSEPKGHGGMSCCLKKKGGGGGDDTEETSETSASSEAEEEEEKKEGKEERNEGQQNRQGATLVTVDGDAELEMETLLKASAYILGATGSSIVYKAVLADGTALAVRRIGESSSVDRLKDFEAQVRSIAKLRHPNLLRIWGFYWGVDEKLLIHDYAPNGSLANITFSKKLGSSPFHLSWEARLRIARGVAAGLAYIHEKKSVHGDIKPSNILLGANMEPKIGDFGLDRLLSGDGINKPGTSQRLFGSKRSTQSLSSLPELSPVPGASPIASTSTAGPSALPYQAPESLKNLKPNAKWDVYAFGMVLLELIAGRVFSEAELCQWNAGFVVEERNRILRMADPALRGEVEGKEDALLSCFKLGFACASSAPQRRPSMKDVVLLLDKIPAASSSSLY